MVARTAAVELSLGSADPVNQPSDRGAAFPWQADVTDVDRLCRNQQRGDHGPPFWLALGLDAERVVDVDSAFGGAVCLARGGNAIWA